MKAPSTNFSMTYTHRTSYYGKVSHGEMQLTVQESLDANADKFSYQHLNFPNLQSWDEFTTAINRIDKALRQDLKEETSNASTD